MRTLLTGEGGGEAAGSPLTQGKDAYELEVSSAEGHVGGHKCRVPQECVTAMRCHGHLSPGQLSWLVSAVIMGCMRPADSGVLIFPSHHVEPDTHSSFCSPCLSPGSNPCRAVGTETGVCRERISAASLGKFPRDPGGVFL